MPKRTSPTCVVDLTLDSDDEEQDNRLGDVRANLLGSSSKKAKKTRVGIKSENSNSTPTKYDDVEIVEVPNVNYDDVEVVEASAPTMVAQAPAAAASTQNDDDVVMVGTVNEVKLPHVRPHCTKFPFRPRRSHVRSRTTTACPYP